ncbi:MAG: protein jag [Ruminococcaceae bacterium]|nr:protein jag [Oscillospiraceae bacterium]
MLKQTVATAKTVDLAIEAACAELGVSADAVEVEVLEEGKKGILGLGAVDAKVSVTLKSTPALRGLEFVENLVKNMSLDATVEITEQDDEGATIAINGDKLGILIGRRGDVLDSLQYLATLAANINKNGFYRITVDVQGYREKRAETLRGVAKRMSEKVLKYKRSFALEPMNAYERRIIHSACQDIPGVTTRSIGEGADRKIIISPEKK